MRGPTTMPRMRSPRALVLLVAVVMGAASAGPATADPVAPTYVRSIGGGTAGHAQMYPSGLDMDDARTIYVADTGDDEVEAYGVSGDLLWAIGSRGPKALGRFDNPRDVAYLAGKVYVADTGYKRVQVLDADTGQALNAWGYPFGTIMGISAGVDGSGSPIILVAEVNTSTIKVFTPGGSLIRTVGGQGSGNGDLDQARDAATDDSGTIYVADYKNQRVAKFSPTGTWLLNWGSKGSNPGQMIRPYGVDVDASGNVYVSENNERIQKFEPDGTFLRSWGSAGGGDGQFFILRRVAVGPGTTPEVCGADLWGVKIDCFFHGGGFSRSLGGTAGALGFFNEPYGVAVDTKTFVMDTTNQRVQRFGAGGGFELAWGERGWGEGNPGLNWARDLTTVGGTSGTVWVADTKNNRLLEFTRDGVATGDVLGAGGSAIGQLSWPFALASLGGDLIVADMNNDRVQRWDPATGSVVWSSGGFDAPKDVAVFNGIVYVADSLNRRIVRLNGSTGSFVDAFGGAQAHRLEGIAVQPNGDVWVSDTSRNRLLEYSSSGAFLQSFGSSGAGHGRFNLPAHLEILPGTPDLLFVVDQWNDRIEVFDIG
jgi:tripartite motif-containing protein 71